ncbi:mitogen-activated protein kinase-binding protein 1-like isoform X2 [Orbicella faveolata]|uniref:mitogen-activated protein kinase-binding protein 1-like isoform X2 n=1 Tax=Orbicella faveolata TaxID=48498 RepID=UPI0009E1A49B|nr:mitogen-activated protein kinase-binding protein 1-like isoform X2 [Orbicella faveolata]
MNPDRAGRIPPPTRRLVVRKANSHRDLRPITERATLEKVLGLTVSRNACLACDPVSGLVAYPAGCVVVLFNPRKNKQSFVLNTSKKTITSVAFSGDGKYLATGESGHMPCVRVWDMEDQSHPQISEMAKGHKFGIACVAFSPNLKYVASVGFQHDMIVNIWNWKTGTKVASNKVSSKVSALSFSENGSFFVTVGVRHVKFWYFDTESNKSKVSKTLVINGRAALLGEQRNNTFCDVACGRGVNSDITYCVTNSGLLCSINSKRVLDTWVELKSSKAHALAVSEHYIICGCADGIIRVFNPLKLQFIVTIPKPHFLGVNVAEGIDSSNPLSKPEKAVYPDAIAVALDTVNHRLACVYNDHSLYTWDVKDMKKIGKTWSSLYHSTCVWGVEVYPNVSDNRQAALPPGSFLTCSADDTVRVWNIEEGTSILFERNVYSKEMMRVLYMEDAVANLKDTDISPAIKNMRDSTGDTRNAGVRCLRISPDGQALATGDRSGNVRVYDLMFFDETAKIEAHESEVLCVEFSPTDSGHKLLASAGRDRLIHVFDMMNNFVLVQTLDDHSASITSIRFNMSESDELQLLSCGADKSIIFRTAQQNPEFQFVRTTNYVGKTTLYDMDIDPSGKLAATACQDRNVRVYDVNSGKQTRNYKGTPGDDGTLVRITLDSSGTYAATSCSDKSVCLTEFDSGECVASMSGHSEVVTGLKFSVDCKNLISVGGDGCIFLWKIPTTYMQNMVEKLQGLGQEPDNKIQFGTPIRRETYQMTHPSIIESPEENDFVPAEPSAFTRPTREPSPPVKDYRFSVGQLPAWAKKQLVAEGNEKTSLSPEQDNTGPISQPGGRWAQRVQNGGIHVAGDNGTIQPIPFSFEPADRKRYTIEPISLQEQVRALANSPLERRCSLTRGEDDDLFPADGRAALDKLSEEEDYNEGTAPPGVTVSRGSDVMAQVSRKSSVVMSEAGELKFEEAEELDEGEMKEVIIYLPPSQDDFDSEVARSEKYPFYVPNEVLHPCGAGASCVLKDLPQDVGVEMRPARYDSKSPLYAYSMRELGCKVEKRSLLNEILLRALREMEPSVGSFSDGHVIKSFYPRKGKVPSTKLFSVLAPSGQDKKLNSKQFNESFCAKSCFIEVTNSNLNPTVNKTCFKLNSSTVDNIKFERCKVEIKNLSENKNGPGNRNSNVSKHSERSLWFNGLFNKKVTFGGLVFISLSLLGYYNIAGIQ